MGERRGLGSEEDPAQEHVGGTGECLWKECALFPGDRELARSSAPLLNPTQPRCPPNHSHAGAGASYFPWPGGWEGSLPSSASITGIPDMPLRAAGPAQSGAWPSPGQSRPLATQQVLALNAHRPQEGRRLQPSACAPPLMAPAPGPPHPWGLGHPDIHLMVFLL